VLVDDLSMTAAAWEFCVVRWNQKLIGKEYMTASGHIDGVDAGECVLPSTLGLTKMTLEYGNRGGSTEGPARKKPKA